MPEAAEKFREAAKYYEQKAPGVGFTFVAEIHRAVEIAKSHPLSGKAIGRHLRSTPLHNFPFSIIYAPNPELVLIVAVAHQRRRPGYWKHRI
ncbi:hypothetical protein GMLC_03850 [Geomonas limicola]|uniref:Plasmid stabilization protein n=1 Tax=Geomonas limicola TaxID=2740186 RepID=A0A6V8N2S9_9BACT|nr:type II toxin-antitoxin system RelE/ParE family toxin [Geomonas limicola]GFO66806.1 hypothetical protein GMLC_03850 [Geomonas limicola]